jgi:hypothetical protein
MEPKLRGRKRGEGKERKGEGVVSKFAVLCERGGERKRERERERERKRKRKRSSA